LEASWGQQDGDGEGRGEEKRCEREERRRQEQNGRERDFWSAFGFPTFPWDLLGTSWGVLGPSWVPLWSLLGPRGGLRAGSWALFLVSWRPLGASWGQLSVPHVSLFQTGQKSGKLVGGFGAPKRVPKRTLIGKGKRGEPKAGPKRRPEAPKRPPRAPWSHLGVCLVPSEGPEIIKKALVLQLFLQNHILDNHRVSKAVLTPT